MHKYISKTRKFFNDDKLYWVWGRPQGFFYKQFESIVIRAKRVLITNQLNMLAVKYKTF